MRIRLLLNLLILMIFFLGNSLLLVSAQETGNKFTGHVVAVTAGDTIDVRVGGSWTVTVRLHGVECPSKPRMLRETATRYTSRLVLDTDVRVEVRGTASRSVVYGEVYPQIGTNSVNILLARDGLASWANLYAATRDDIRAAENEAQQERLGIWGDKEGADVKMPPATADILRQQAKTRQGQVKRPKVVVPPKPKTIAKPVAPPKEVAPLPQKTVPPPTPTVTMVAHTRPTFPAFVVGGSLLFFLSLLSLIGYTVGHGLFFSVKRLLAQITISLIAGGFGAMLFSVPIADFPFPSIGATIPVRPLIALTFPLLATFFLYWGSGQAGNTARLRIAPVDPRQAPTGFVKLQGIARSLTGNCVYSNIGEIPGLYIREINSRYTTEGLDGKRMRSPRWQIVRDLVMTVDFELFSTAGDGTGSAIVLAAQDEDRAQAIAPAEWIPYHVARFYNEVPTDAWYKTAYEGDTRSEVFFVPDEATLTVWGHLYPPSTPDSRGLIVPQIAPNGASGRLLICDGPESRAYSGRGGNMAVGIGAILLGTLCAAVGFFTMVIGSIVERQSALASLGLALVALLFLAVRHAALLARNHYAERIIDEPNPLRRPAGTIWDSYRRGFPGILLAPAVGET